MNNDVAAHHVQKDGYSEACPLREKCFKVVERIPLALIQAQDNEMLLMIKQPAGMTLIKRYPGGLIAKKMDVRVQSDSRNHTVRKFRRKGYFSVDENIEVWKSIMSVANVKIFICRDGGVREH